MTAIDSVFTALAEPRRRHLVELLRDGPTSVGALADATGLSQPGTSKHLRVLRDAGLVRAEVEGRRRLYRVCPEALRQLDTWLAPWRRLWADSFDRLERALDEAPSPAQEQDHAPDPDP